VPPLLHALFFGRPERGAADKRGRSEDDSRVACALLADVYARRGMALEAIHQSIDGATFRFLRGQLSVFGEGASKTVTPEPASVMLLSIGAIALVVRRRRPQRA